MADPIYIYIDFGNGQQFEKALDWHDDQAVLAAVRLGVRLACRGLCGVSLPSLLTYGWEACLELDTVRVLSQIVREALAKRGVTQGDGGGGDREVNQARTKPPVCVIIHLDEFQLYIQRAAHVQGGDMNEGREYFKDMVRTILDFMKNVSPSQLGGECFVLPLCTGTSACDITFLPTESNRKTVSMAPLTAASVDAMAVEYYGQEFSNHLTNVRWKMAVGDSMGIPRFVEWMLLGRRDAWSDTLSNEIQAKEALQDLANYGGPDGAERLIALALVRKPVSRTFSLGDSIGTIGELERPGTFYLVPVSSVAGMYYVEIPLPVCRTMCMQLEKIGRPALIPSELLFSPTPLRPWFWQDFEKLYPFYQRALVQALSTLVEGNRPVKVNDLFRGALGTAEVLDYEVVLPPSVVYTERQKFLATKSDQAMPGAILCNAGSRSLEEGIFICAEGNALIDHRFACLPTSSAAPPAAFFIQTKNTHTKDTTVSASSIKTWYNETMVALQAYTNHYFVVLVFMTNKTFRGNAHAELFSNGCPQLLLLVNDDMHAIPPSLVTFLGPTFAHRAVYAPNKEV